MEKEAAAAVRVMAATAFRGGDACRRARGSPCGGLARLLLQVGQEVGQEAGQKAGQQAGQKAGRRVARKGA